ncbi:MAG TPA: hypothetical protein DHV14_06165 [Micrococcales bacterium]|nr:hypothetical protein [Micrococcales bacterium]
MASEQLTALWRRQRARRPRSARSGAFGPPGWLIDAELAGTLAGHVERLPAFDGDTLQTTTLPPSACATLLDRVPAKALDDDHACGPTTRSLASAALAFHELRPFGYVVGPDRVDERVALDGVRVAVGGGSPVTHEDLAILLDRYRREDSAARRSRHHSGRRTRPGSSHAGLRLTLDDDDELAALARAADELTHLTRALAPLWPVVREAFGLPGVRHAPDEIGLMPPLRPPGDSFRVRGDDAYDAPAVGGVRLWWRFGASRFGCPTRGGRHRPITIDELTRRLGAPASRASPGT